MESEKNKAGARFKLLGTIPIILVLTMLFFQPLINSNIIPSVHATTPPTNVVVNGGFEAGTYNVGPSLVPNKWTWEAGTPPSLRNDEHHSGSWSLAASYNGTYYNAFTLTQRVRAAYVSSWNLQEVSVWYKYGTADDYFAVNYTDGTISQVQCLNVANWTKVSITPLANKFLDSVIIKRTNAHNRICCWDDVTIARAIDEPHNADAMWIEPSVVSFSASTTSVGFKFNVTVAMNFTEDVFAWQAVIYYNATQLNCTRVGATAGSTSAFMTGHSATFSKVINSGAYPPLNGSLKSVLAAETCSAPDFVPGPHSGTLFWAEFQILLAPSAGQTFNSKFDISTEYAANNVYVWDSTGTPFTFTPYDGTYQFAGIPPPSVSISPFPFVFMDVGQSQLFTSNVSGGMAPYYYQWYRNGGPLSGANSSSWSFVPPATGSYIEISVGVIDSAGEQVMSDAATVFVNDQLNASVLPSSVVMDVNQSRAFASSISGGTSPFTYQWYLNGNPILNAINSTWTFQPNSTGSYTVYVLVTDNATVPCSAPSNNASVTVVPGVHDIAVVNITSYKTVVCRGYSLNVSVIVANQGDFNETFNLAAYANTTIIASQNITLPIGNSTTVTFTWNTTTFAEGNYTISAYVWPVPGETNTANNNFTGGWVVVSIAGDLTGGTSNPWDFVPDGKVDGKDIAIVAMCYGSAPGCLPPYVWNANCDVNNDGKIDGADIATVALHYGQAGP